MIKAALLLALPLTMACLPPPAIAPGVLDKTAWHFTSIDGKAPIGKDARLTFSDGRVGANVGCNGLGSDFRVVGRRLMTGPVIGTQMFCEGVMDQERAVSQLLSAQPVVTLRGGVMMLEGNGHKAELRRKD
jgi:heat shock protein HslJ